MTLMIKVKAGCGPTTPSSFAFAFAFSFMLFFITICISQKALCIGEIDVGVYGDDIESESGSETSLIASLKYWFVKDLALDETSNIWDVGGGDGSLVFNILKANQRERPSSMTFYSLIEKNYEKSTIFHQRLMADLSNGDSSMSGKVALLNMEPKFTFLDHIVYDVGIPRYCYSENALTSENCRRFCQQSLHCLLRYAAMNCPSLIIFHNSGRVDDTSFDSDRSASSFEALFSLSQVLDDCRPTIYMSNISSSQSRVFIDFLSQWYSYDNLMWNVYPTESSFHDSSMPFSLNVDLIASSKLVDAADSSKGYVKLQPYKYYITEYPEFVDLLINDFSLFSAWSFTCIDGSMPPCIAYLDRYYEFSNQYQEKHRSQSYKVLKDATSDIFLTDEIDLLPPYEVEVYIIELLELKSSYAVNHTSLKQVLASIVAHYPHLTRLSVKFNLKQSAIERVGLISFLCTSWIRQFLYIVFPHKSISVFDSVKNEFIAQQTAAIFSWLDIFDSFRDQCISFLGAQADFKRRTQTNVLRIKYNDRHKFHNLIRSQEGKSRKSPNDSNELRKSFHPSVNIPFQNNFDINTCFEPIFCNHTFEFYRRLELWQNPKSGAKPLDASLSLYLQSMQHSQVSNSFSCDRAKFLVFQPMSSQHGIGSMINQIATVLKRALEHDRILILEHPAGEEENLKKWKVHGCETATFECIFQPLSHCVLTNDELISAQESINGKSLHKFFHKNLKVIRYVISHDNLTKFDYSSEWKGSLAIFDGLLVRHHDDASLFGIKKMLHIFDNFYDRDFKKINHFSTFLSSIKSTWASVIVRYIFRPREWLSRTLQDIVASTLIGPDGSIVDDIPRPYASLHVRYGLKRFEVPLQDLSRYMQAMVSKKKHIKNIFLSTETEAVINILRQDYPSYNFYHLKYPRMEVLIPKDSSSGDVKDQSFSDELLYSMANLYVSVEADAFVGTLTSNWCQLINYLQRSRGDAGFDYLSVDGGSQYSTAYLR